MAKFFLFAVILLLPLAVLVAAEDLPAACNDRIFDMMGCINYVLIGSNLTKPDPECCFGVESVVQVNPLCLCVANDRVLKAGYVINATRDSSLAGDCNVSVPDNICQDTSVSPAPASAPLTSPVPPPSTEPSPAPLVSPSASPSPSPLPSIPAPPVSQPSPPQPSPAPAPALPPQQPAEPSPAPPVSPPAESEPAPPPLPSQPSPAPEIPPVGSPSESDTLSSRSAPLELPSSVMLFAGVFVAGFAFLSF